MIRSLITALLATSLLSLPLQAEGNVTLDTVSRSVVFLHRTLEQGGTSLGTGFLVNFQDLLYLVTAEHVANSLDRSADVTFGDASDVAVTVKLTKLAGHSKLSWVTHGTADVAVLALTPPTEIADLLAPRALQPAIFITKLEAPPRNRPLTTVGYPLGLGGLLLGSDKRISPLSRESRPASGLLTLPRADTQTPIPTFLLDSPSIGGFSGAPVFMLPAAFSQGPGVIFSASAFCVGLVHGTWSDNTGGKLAAIVPVAYIVQTLDKAHSKRKPPPN